MVLIETARHPAYVATLPRRCRGDLESTLREAGVRGMEATNLTWKGKTSPH